MRYHILLVVLLFSGARSYGQSANPTDTLSGQVVHWENLKASSSNHITTRQVLYGATRDLSQLEIKAVTLDTGVIIAAYGKQFDELIIVKEGQLDVSAGEDQKVLAPGGVALFDAGERYSLENGGKTPVTYYILRFYSRGNTNPGPIKPPVLIDWSEMVMKMTNKGESRQIFSQPVVWLGKLDMHATTLNKGEVSHPPHVHRSEEIILLRSGNAREFIGGKYYPAAAGDLLFLPSEVPHALENVGSGRCEYFALQWQLQ